jgi:hypothetical protein
LGPLPDSVCIEAVDGKGTMIVVLLLIEQVDIGFIPQPAIARISIQELVP